MSESPDDGDSISGNFRKFPVGENDLNEDSSCLNERRRMAIELLATGKTGVAAARLIGVDPRTIYNWRQDPTFRRELGARTRQLWADVSLRLRGLIHPALDELETQLHDRYDRARFRAASTLLRLADVKKCPQPEEEE